MSEFYVRCKVFSSPWGRTFKIPGWGADHLCPVQGLHFGIQDEEKITSSPPEDEDKTRWRQLGKSYLFTSPPTLPPSSFSQAGWLSVDPDQHCLSCRYSKASKASSSASSTWPVVLCSDAHAVGDVPWSTLHSLGNPQLFSCLQHPGLIKGKTSFWIWNKKTPPKSDKHFIWIKDQPPWSLLWGMSCGRRSLVWYWSTARPDVDLD